MNPCFAPKNLPRLLRGLVAAAALSLAIPLGAGLQAPAQSAPAAPAYRLDRVLVAFHPAAAMSARAATLSRLGLRLSPKAGSPHFAVLYLPPSAASAGDPIPGVLAQLRRDPAVRLAEPDYALRTSLIPNDPRFSSLWGLHNQGQTGGVTDADIDAPEAWDTTTGSANVVVAVIDTGVDYRHPDLKDNILTGSDGSVVGYDFANGDADPMDDHGHGTHCAGTIGARGNDGVGVVGVSPNVKIMPLKFLDAEGSGWTSDAVACIDFARAAGARIMSNSWGGGGQSQILLESIQRAGDAGILFVAAAGNDSGDNDAFPHYPSSYATPNMMGVAATNHSDRLAWFSNYGDQTVHLAAPGEDILSTLPGGQYGVYSGTSMATPHVAGAAALVLAAHPSLTMAELKDRLLRSVEFPTALSGRVMTGRLNVASAVDGGANPPPPPPSGDRFEPDNTAAAAKVIVPAQPQNRSLHLATDVDWAKFTLTVASDVVLETSGTEGDTVMALYGPNSTTRLVASDDDGGAGYFSRIAAAGLPTGTYYVQVRAYAGEEAIHAYTLALTARPVAQGDAFEADNTPAAAKVIRIGTGQVRSIHTARDVDWAKFTLTTTTSVVIQTSGQSGDTMLWLYGSNGTRLIARDDNSGVGSFSRLVALNLRPGTYHIRVGENGANAVIPTYRLTLTRGSR